MVRDRSSWRSGRSRRRHSHASCCCPFQRIINTFQLYHQYGAVSSIRNRTFNRIINTEPYLQPHHQYGTVSSAASSIRNRIFNSIINTEPYQVAIGSISAAALTREQLLPLLTGEHGSQVTTLSDAMYLLIHFRKSTLPQYRQLHILISNSKQ